MTVDESKRLKKGSRVYWQGDVADSGVIAETSWDAVTIAWDNGHVARVLRGDMRNSAIAHKAAHDIAAAELALSPAPTDASGSSTTPSNRAPRSY